MNKEEFPKPSITGDVIVFDAIDQEILLIKRKKDPFGGHWAIVGGFFNPIDRDNGEKMDFSVRDAAIRELREETNIDLEKLNKGSYAFEFVTVQDAPNRDTRGRVVTLVYVLEYYGKRELLNVKAMDDAEDFRWFKLSEVVNRRTANGEEIPLAFDHHDSITRFAKRIRYA